MQALSATVQLKTWTYRVLKPSLKLIILGQFVVLKPFCL